MALVTKLGNLIQKFKENPEVSKYLNSLPNQDEWKQFVEGELKRSNETNNKNLGGQQPRSSMDEDDDSKDYEMNMEKIMAKFSNFNTGMSNKSNNDDDEEEEEETEINKNQDEEDKEKHEYYDDEQKAEGKIDTEPMLSLEPLDQEFVDQTYWKTDVLGGKSVEDLMADYE